MDKVMNLRSQKGVVLFFAIIVLLVLTIIGVSLAVNSTMSLNMANAGSERIEAIHEINEGLQNTFAQFRASDVDQIDALLPDPDIIRLPALVGTTKECTFNKSYCCVIYEVSQTVQYGKQNVTHPPMAYGIEKVVKLKDGNQTCN